MKILVVYYSYSGITRRLAEDIALITDGDLLELKPLRPYSFSYNTAVKEARIEIDKGYCPPLTEEIENIDDVDVVFIGSPNWLKTFAPPVLTFLRSANLDGKTIIPFCTHGGGGFGRMIDYIKKECKNSTVKDGVALSGFYDFDELQKWLGKNL